MAITAHTLTNPSDEGTRVHMLDSDAFGAVLEQEPPNQTHHPQLHDGNLTQSAEWNAIMYQQLMPGEVMLIAATAGAGKSTALREYTRMRSNVPTLYLTFSKASQNDMQKQYQAPGLQHVDVRTVSSLIWEATNEPLNFGYDVGQPRGKQRRALQNELFLKKHLAEIMCDPAGAAVRTQSDSDLVMCTLDAFFVSTDTQLEPCHVKSCTAPEGTRVLDMAQRVWEAMIDPTQTKWPIVTHGTAGKYFQLHPELQARVFARYGLVMVDESHDLTLAQIEPIARCACAKVIVYDVHQAIYGWRGARAIDAIAQLHAVARRSLSQTWRYGAPLAAAAAAVVSHIKGITPGAFTITGKPGHTTSMAVAKMPCTEDGRIAVLARMNMTLFNMTVGLLERQPQLKVHFLGHDSAFGWISGGKKALNDVYQFKCNGVPLPNTSFTCFYKYKSWLKSVKNYSKLTVCALVEVHGHRLPELMRRVDAAHMDSVAQQRTPADVILSTVHKAKGLGFPSVFLCDDILCRSVYPIDAAISVQNSLPESESVETDELLRDLRYLLEQTGIDVDEEANILYVGMTRAENKLTVATKLAAWLEMCGVTFGTCHDGACRLSSSSVHADPTVALADATVPIVPVADYCVTGECVISRESRVYTSRVMTEQPPPQPLPPPQPPPQPPPPAATATLTPWQRIQLPASSSLSSTVRARPHRVDAERAATERKRSSIAGSVRCDKRVPPFARLYG